MSLKIVSPVNKQWSTNHRISTKTSTGRREKVKCTNSYRNSSQEPFRSAKSPAEELRVIGSQGSISYEEEVGYCNPYTQFSPEFIQERALQDASDVFRVTKRFFEITFSLSGYAASLFSDAVSGSEDEKVPQRAAELRKLLCRLGPVFIKAGQTLANRPDVIREDYMRELTYLQDEVPQFSNEKAFRILEEQLKRPPMEVFSSISANPVAAASIGQVYKATLRSSGEEVAIKIQRPGVESIIYQDLYLFRRLASLINGWTLSKLGCNAALIIDEFAQKLLEELDYRRELLNLQDFYRNFYGDKSVKIPKAYSSLCSESVLVMEWIDGIRCTDIDQVRRAVNTEEFIRVGVKSGLRQLLEFGLFHGDPHPGNIFAMRDGRIAYVDFGNVAQLSQSNKEVLIDAVVHAVNEDYTEMAGDFVRLGFLSDGVDITPIVPALESIWQDSSTKSMATFNFRTVTTQFNKLVYQYPIRIPQRYALVIRSLLIQEGICMALEPQFKFLEVAYPYVARRLLTDNDPGLRNRLFQVLVRDDVFQWMRLQNLIVLAKGSGEAGLQMKKTLKEGVKFIISSKGEPFRAQLLRALTQNNRLAITEITETLALLEGDIVLNDLLRELVQDVPTLSREILLAWSSRVLTT